MITPGMQILMDLNSTRWCNSLVFSGSIPDLEVSCQGTSRAVVESFHDCLHLVVGDDGEVTVLGEVLPDEAVVIFVESTFPRTAGMGEIDVGVSTCAATQQLAIKSIMNKQHQADDW